MKKVYKLFFLIAVVIVSQGRSGGPGTVAMLEVTGAPGSMGNLGTCGNSGCHTDGSFEPTLNAGLSDIDFNAILEYEPGTAYFLDFSFEAANGTPGGSGFQAVALDGSNANAGTWSTIPSAAQTATLNGREYLEHNEGNSNLIWDVQWTAPPAGTGEVTFYLAGIASNLNGNNQGDGVSSTTVTVQEAGASSISQLEQSFARISLAPNPITNASRLSINSKEAGDFQLNIINTTGQLLRSESIRLNVGQNDELLNLSELTAGLYMLQVIGEDNVATKQFVKL